MAEDAEDLVRFREAAPLLLREHELTVGEHVELALEPFDDGGGNSVGVQHGRETRSPAVVATSDGAVVDLDSHVRTLPRRLQGQSQT